MAGEAEDITVVREPGRDKYGDRKTGPDVEFVVSGCQFAPGPSREVNFAAEQVLTDATVYAPAGTAVLPSDKVRRNKTGDLYGVVGKPQDWGLAGVVILLKQTTG